MIYTVTLSPALDYLMDLPGDLVLDKVNRSQSTMILPGGKGIIESRMLGRLGVPNKALGFVGGFTGQLIVDQLASDGVVTQFTQVEAPTRINVTIKSKEGETSVNDQNPAIEPEALSVFLAQFDQLTPDDIVVFAGSIPTSLGEDFYLKLIKLTQAKGAQFAIDVDGPKLLDVLPYGPLVIKPNRQEIEELFGKTFSSLDELMPYGKKLLDKGAQHVMVSMAGDGALLFEGDQVYFASPITGYPIKNSIGAGDSTVAGFLATYSQTQDALAAFRQGVAAGSAKVFSQDMPDRAFITELFNQVDIKQL